MSLSSARRGQAEPLAALVALAAVCAGLTLYAGALADAVPATDRDLARPTLVSVYDQVGAGGVVRPALLSNVSTPAGHRTNVTLRADGGVWRLGPTPPPHDTDTARRAAAVRVGPGRVDAGTLRVEVWT